MSKLIDEYNKIVSHIQYLNGQIDSASQKIDEQAINVSRQASIRIEKIKEQLEKIDTYLLKVRAFQELAKKNLNSQNVSTIEAPEGYRVNLNRLRNWAMMIDPSSDNDPYAQRVYVVAKCDEYFLLKKQEEFKKRIEELKKLKNSGDSQEVGELRQLVNSYKNELKDYVMSDEFKSFCKKVITRNDNYSNAESPSKFENTDTAKSMISPGTYSLPLYLPDSYKYYCKELLHECYDAEERSVLLPVEISNTKEYVLSIHCSPVRRKMLDYGISNLLLETINSNPAGKKKIYVLDGIRLNTSSITPLRQLEGSFALQKVPRNPDQLTSTLEEIVSSFADIDEKIELYDSVNEYNSQVEEDKQIPTTTLLIFGGSTSFEGHDLELLKRIVVSYERYGVSIIMVDYHFTKQDEDHKIPEYALQNAININVYKDKSLISVGDDSPLPYKWYVFNNVLNQEFVEEVLKIKIEKRTLGNEYPNRYPLDQLSEYTRDYKKIELPYGIDNKDKVHSLSFENENFAAYLMGASRSGKSTLLHTLITGLIRNYHPDNLELWLADFKQLEFKKYIEHCPAHVKYILLDESKELVFDLIDKLTAKMMERQRLFSQLRVERIDQLDPLTLKDPVPVIFVILDEFSIMSQSIAESDDYRLKLQNLLAKGAALGIKFLFSSQTFTTGVTGLTQTARAQIQQRISMKGSKSEINETLELSANIRTEQVNNWIEALPPHYALVKHRISADALPEVNRVLVMYIPDYSYRDQMIDTINSRLIVSEEYHPEKINTYKKKYPVIVDGNSYEAFNTHIDDLKQWKDYAPNKVEYTGDEIFINVGTPRRMEAMMPIVVTPETRENIILVSNSSELACTAAITKSVIESFQIQGGKVHIWAYGRNRLYRIYQNVWKVYNLACDLDDVCNEIREMRQKIDNHVEGHDLIVFIGMEHMYDDFSFVKEKSSKTKNLSLIDEFKQNGGLVESDDNDEEDLFSFLNNLGDDLEVEEQPSNVESKVLNEPVIEKTGAYNAQEDFIEILRQGSRLGYHVFSITNSIDDVKQSRIKLDLFRHRMSFKITKDDSWELFGNRNAVGLPEHICQYSNAIHSYSFRPYLHAEFAWDGWAVDENGCAVNHF